MRKLLIWLVVLSSIRFYAASVSPAPGDNIKTDYENSWSSKQTQNYWVNASTGHTFAVSRTQAGGGGTLFTNESQSASAFKTIIHGDEPQTNNFTFWVEGYFAGSGDGSPIDWKVTLEQRFFWLAPAEKIISAGTAQAIDAKGYLPTSRWSIRNKVLKDWRDENSAEEESDSVTLNNNMWVKMLWMPSPLPWYYKIPEGGDYHISATTVEEGSRTANSHIKVIEAQFIKETIYKSWNKFETFDVVSYLTPASHDKSNFSWTVQGDAKLKMTTNNQTVYNSTFTPSETTSFSNYIRFDNPGGQTDSNVTVTATSGDLTSVSGTLTIVPQSLNIDISNVPEEEYDAEGNLTAESKRVNEGTIGAFIPVNDGDLNTDRNVDYEHGTESGSSTAAGRLIAVSISAVLDEAAIVNAAHPVKITLSHGGFRIWKDADRSELYIDGSGTKEFTTLEGLGSVYVEATSASTSTLTISYSYSHAGDVTTRKQYMISASDSIKLNGFKVDISVQGIDNEKAITSEQTKIRTLAYEEFPGGEMEVVADAVIGTPNAEGEIAIINGTNILKTLTLGGSNLTRDGNYLDIDGDGIAVNSDPDEDNPDNLLECTLTVSSGSDKIKLYQRSLDESNVPKSDSNGNPLYKAVSSGVKFKASELNTSASTLYLLPVKDSADKRDVVLEQTYTSPQNATIHKDIIKITNLRLDLDADSNGDGTVDVDSYEEDSMEENVHIDINAGDKDNDSILDTVDYTIASAPVFEPLVLTIPQSIKLDNCKIKITYGAGTPPLAENGTLVSGGTQSLRIWTKQSNTARDPHPIVMMTSSDQPTSSPYGDYVAPNSGGTYYTPSQLLGSGNRQGTFYVESLCAASDFKADIVVTLEPIISRDGNAVTLPTNETTIPETITVTDKVGFSTLDLDLDIDSDNNAWTSWTPDNLEDPIEDSASYPGKIIFTNEGCESGDEKPDYANLGERSRETNLVPLKLTLNTALSLSNLKIKFEYEGENTLPDFTSATSITGNAIMNIPFTTGKTYKDYTILKKNILRIWAGISSYTAARKANKFGTKSDSQLTAPDGNYLAPDTYSVELLFDGQTGPDYSLNMWVEAVNPSDATRIKATLLYNDNNNIADTIKIKSVEGNLTVNVDNDPDFELNGNDDKLEDQNDGFNCWNGQLPDGTTPDTEESRLCSHGLENIFPLKADLDSSIAYYFRYYTKIEPVNHLGTGEICENVNYANARMQYLKDNSTGISQIAKTNNLNSTMLLGEFVSGMYYLPREDYELLFGLESAEVYKITLYAELQVTSSAKPQITVDTCKVTGRDIAKFFWYGSCRGSKISGFDYPTDKTRYVTMDRYPDVSQNTNFGNRETKRDKYLIFLHGYNVDEDAAVVWNKVVFRRLYWSGYRGNYIGITWHGDEYITVFDPNVRNAMESSPAVMRFIKNTMQGTWGVSSANISIAAHSLGNLVMWDALRLFKHQYSGDAATTAISIEAAVWQEAFGSEDDFQFNWEMLTFDEYNHLTNTTTGNTTYSIDDLTKNSWSFWFNQKTVGGNSLIAKDVVSSNVNSYLLDDEALAYMITNENILRPYSHFFRTTTTYRTPASLDTMPRMLRNSNTVTLRYLPPAYGGKVDSEDLSFAVGTISNNYFKDNKDASSYGWRSEKHSDLKNLELYKIYDWYKIVLKNNL